MPRGSPRLELEQPIAAAYNRIGAELKASLWLARPGTTFICAITITMPRLGLGCGMQGTGLSAMGPHVQVGADDRRQSWRSGLKFQILTHTLMSVKGLG